MEIKLISAREPKWGNKEKTILNLLVKFEHIAGEIPFSAIPNDVETHGRDIFERGKKGEFGDIGPFVGLNEKQEIEKTNIKDRINKLNFAVTQADHFIMMEQTKRAKEWRQYYQKVYNLIYSKEWPDIIWPEEPSGPEEK